MINWEALYFKLLKKESETGESHHIIPHHTGVIDDATVVLKYPDHTLAHYIRWRWLKEKGDYVAYKMRLRTPLHKISDNEAPAKHRNKIKVTNKIEISDEVTQYALVDFNEGVIFVSNRKEKEPFGDMFSTMITNEIRRELKENLFIIEESAILFEIKGVMTEAEDGGVHVLSFTPFDYCQCGKNVSINSQIEYVRAFNKANSPKEKEITQ